MSTHKHFDKICCVVLVFTLLLTVLFVHAESFGIKKASSAPGYETRLFDTASVHTIDSTVDVETVIRYFVVHNFVLNFDSYTGSMVHNYYLYEKDGQMQMIPWDYNLAFGGFESAGDATSIVNYPIDSPVSGGNIEDRPMLAWIFASEEYTALYHRNFSEFISEWFDSGNFESMIESVSAMITPYVEQDPTKFCTFEEFETGVSTLGEFCRLRAGSIEGQLNGSIGSTSDTQQSSERIDAGDLQISDMGSMQNVTDGGTHHQYGIADDNEPIQRDAIGQKNAPGQSAASLTTLLWIVTSIILLILAILFVFRFRGRRYNC